MEVFSAAVFQLTHFICTWSTVNLVLVFLVLVCFFWRNKRLNDYADIRYAVYSHILYITFVINTIYHKKSQGNYDHKIFLKTEKRERDSQYLKA